MKIKDLFYLMDNLKGVLMVNLKDALVVNLKRALMDNLKEVWSSLDLKFAKENGYNIKVIKGYNFNKRGGGFIAPLGTRWKKRGFHLQMGWNPH
jgi:hypothetical protein